MLTSFTYNNLLHGPADEIPTLFKSLIIHSFPGTIKFSSITIFPGDLQVCFSLSLLSKAIASTPVQFLQLSLPASSRARAFASLGRGPSEKERGRRIVKRRVLALALSLATNDSFAGRELQRTRTKVAAVATALCGTRWLPTLCCGVASALSLSLLSHLYTCIYIYAGAR